MDNSAKIRVLLVEDHTMTRMGMQLVLEKDTAIELIGEAEDGQSGVELAQSLKPDVILMDIGLPVIDGIEATKKIKEMNIGSNILVFTSRDSENDVFAALGAGADGYIMKGATPDQLTSAIKAVNDGTAWLDPTIAKMVLRNVTASATSTSNTQAVTKKEFGKYSSIYCLTERELEVLKHIVEGMTNPQIAEKLFITRATAKAHVHSILQKLCVDDRTQAAVTAMREGLV